MDDIMQYIDDNGIPVDFPKRREGLNKYGNIATGFVYAPYVPSYIYHYNDVDVDALQAFNNFIRGEYNDE